MIAPGAFSGIAPPAPAQMPLGVDVVDLEALLGGLRCLGVDLPLDRQPAEEEARRRLAEPRGAER